MEINLIGNLLYHEVQYYPSFYRLESLQELSRDVWSDVQVKFDHFDNFALTLILQTQSFM